MVLGAEQGVYALDLSDMSGEDEAPLVQVFLGKFFFWNFFLNFFEIFGVKKFFLSLGFF